MKSNLNSHHNFTIIEISGLCVYMCYMLFFDFAFWVGERCIYIYSLIVYISICILLHSIYIYVVNVCVYIYIFEMLLPVNCVPFFCSRNLPKKLSSQTHWEGHPGNPSAARSFTECRPIHGISRVNIIIGHIFIYFYDIAKIKTHAILNIID